MRKKHYRMKESLEKAKELLSSEELTEGEGEDHPREQESNVRVGQREWFCED